MGEWSGFFPSDNGDRKYRTAQVAACTNILFGSGVAQTGELELTQATGMTATLSVGWALLNGYYYQNDAPKTLTFDYADGVLDRIDAVVVRRNVNTRDIHAVVITGAPAISPTPPAPVRDAENYDLCLYHVRIPAGATEITNSMISDKRADQQLCGYVYCRFQGIDTSVLLAQYETWFKELSEKSTLDMGSFEAEFVAWFNTMKDQLSEDAAGKLQLELDALGLARARLYSCTLTASGWSAADSKSWKWEQTVSCPGATENTVGAPPFVLPTFDAETDEANGEALSLISGGETGADTARFVCMEDRPETDLELHFLGVDVNNG